MLVIHPDECIDCGVCNLNARSTQSNRTRSLDFLKWLEINAKYAQVWPNITIKREPPPDAKDWEGRPGKAATVIAQSWHR